MKVFAARIAWLRSARAVVCVLVACSALAVSAPGAQATQGTYCVAAISANTWCQDALKTIAANYAYYAYPNSYSITVCQKINAYGGTKIVETCGTNVSGTSVGNCCNYARYALIGNPQQDHAWTMYGQDYF